MSNTVITRTAVSDDKVRNPVPKTKKAKEKVEKVMGEYKSGDLKSSSGDPVTKKSQAVAIALSEARRKKK